MQQAVQAQTINVEGVGSQFAGELSEFLFDLLGDAHVKHALHQSFNREQMRIDVLEIRHGLLEAIARLFCRRRLCQGVGRNLILLLTRALLFLQIFQHPSRERPEGLVMATRSGNVDPGLLLELMREGYSEDQMATILQKESGLKGLSSLSGDMRTVREAAATGHNGAIRALDVFRHRLLQLLGSMAASLGGVDVLALTGGIGEHDKQLHQELASALSWWGDFATVVIPADEEGMIARLCQRHSDTPASAAVG